MNERRQGEGARVARAFACAVVIASMHALSSEAAAQAQEPTDARPAEPSAAAPVQTIPPAQAEEPAPMEFPGMTQSGTVTVTRSPFERPWPTQRNFAFVATEGSFNGFGLGIRAGWLRVGWDASFAFLPIFATYTYDPDEFPEFKLLSGFQANASMYVGIHRLDAKTDLGITFGYKYNTLMKHGGTVAFYFQRELGAHWALQAFVGPTIFPDAENQIRKETGWSGGSVLSGMAWHQAGLGAQIAFFP